MTNQAYPTLPGYVQWLKDSTSPGNRIRGNDKTLNRIDELLDATSKADSSMRQLLTVDLFWCLDYWLKVFRKNPDMDPSREGAIFKLYVTVVNQLCSYFKCQSNTLVNKLEEAFGRSVDGDGLHVDVKLNWVKYFSDAERKLYKLRFKNGRVYQRQWWKETPNLSEFAPVESSRASDLEAFFNTGADKTGYAGFVMSMSRDFYMAKHGGPNQKGSRVFHSSYLGSNLVACAGTMLIQNGDIKVICPDSGHFKPGDINVMMMLRALRMLGVCLENVIVQHFDGTTLGTADAILKVPNWQTVLNHMEKNRKQLMQNQAELQQLSRPPGPVHVYKTQTQVSQPPQVNSIYKTPGANPAYKRVPQSLQQMYINAREMNRIYFS